MRSAGKIIHKRRVMGLTQECLAEKIGVSRQTIAMWETGRQLPTDNVVIITARHLDMNEDALLELVEEDRLSHRLKTLEQRYDVKLSIDDSVKEDGPMTTQTKNGVTFYVFQILKSIDYAWGGDGDGTSNLGKPIAIIWHKGKLLIVRTCITCSNGYIDINKIRANITVKDSDQNIPYRIMGGVATRKDGVYYDTYPCEYSDSTRAVNISCNLVSRRESDCEVVSFENIPLDAKGIKKSASDCDVTLTGISEFSVGDGWRNHWVETELSVPVERKHVGIVKYTDDLNNMYGRTGAGFKGDREQKFQLNGLLPDASSINFKYLISRKELSFQLENIPVP